MAENFKRTCPICLKLPHEPISLPCQHIVCVPCVNSFVDRHMRTVQQENASGGANNGADRVLNCPECRRPFVCLPGPAAGCEPTVDIPARFISITDKFKPTADLVGRIDDVRDKVMGMALLGNLLYVFYHKSNVVYMYKTGPDYDLHKSVPVAGLVWPRGAASCARQDSIYVTDWNKMFAGRLWKISVEVLQSSVLAELSAQPFGVSVPDCQVTHRDRILVTCSTPLRHAMPLLPHSSSIQIIDAVTGQVEKVVNLSDAYEIPRHAILLDSVYYVCHGWLRPGKVVRVDDEGHQLKGVYGSDIAADDQSLNRPLLLCPADKGFLFAVDYFQHRVHLLTTQLQLVGHLVHEKQEYTDRYVHYVRQLCYDSNTGHLYVGTESGSIGVYSCKSN